MSKTSAETDASQAIGLDVGTSRIVAARNVEKRFQYEAQLNAFVSLPHSKLTSSLMLQENVFHEVQGSEIIVAGDDAEKFAEVFHVETRRPMLNGTLNPNEPLGLSVIRRIIGKLIGPAAKPGQRVFFSVPAPAAGIDGNLSFHEASIKHLLTDMGYEARSINEGLAVVFGELGNSNYTGIGISCGSGLCNACLAVLSLPVISFSVPKAGDFVDRHAALATGDLATRIRVEKERSFQLNGFTGDRLQNALNVYYDEVIMELVAAIRENLSSARRLPKLDHAIPLVLSGGTAMPKGFLERFEKALHSSELAIRISEVKLSADPLQSTARGSLMAALC